MKKIPLSGKNGKGKFAIVDDDDFDSLSKFTWFFLGMNTRYVCRTQKTPKRTFTMHRQVLGLPYKTGEVDHINRNTLDNRKSNLRICTKSQNQGNKPIQRNNTSGYKGVSSLQYGGKWTARISIKGKNTHIGQFETKEEAAIAYNKKAVEVFGEYAYQNVIKSQGDAK